MELARMLFEGLCTKAVLQSQKAAFKGLEQSQNVFGKNAPNAAKKSGGAPHVAFGCSFLFFLA